MNKLSIVAILFCLVAVVFCGSVDLTSADFDSTLSENEFVLTMFYAPWCGHCKSLKPKYDEAADEVEGKYVISKVDCTEEEALCGKYGVRGYPTLIFFKNGNQKPYDGPRTKEGIIQWLDKNSGPAVTTLDTQEKVDEFVAKETAVIAYFSEDSEAKKVFVEAADSSKADAIPFGIVTDSALFGDNEDGTIQFIRSESVGEDVVVSEEDAKDAETLASYLFDANFPIVGEVGPENFKDYVARGKQLFLSWFDLSSDSLEDDKETLRKIAAEQPEYSFGFIDGKKFGSNMQKMGTPKDTLPAIIRLDFKENKPVVYQKEDGEFGLESVKEWIEGTISGKYKYVLKSEETPENNDGPVTVLVGNNFDEIVLDEEKDVLVEYYAPWCGHCKSLAPEYEKLGEAFGDVEDIVIAKIDYTANDVESDSSNYQVKGFPTILLYKRDDKKNPVSFEGTRNAKSIAAWIKENTVSEKAAEISHDEL